MQKVFDCVDKAISRNKKIEIEDIGLVESPEAFDFEDERLFVTFESSRTVIDADIVKGTFGCHSILAIVKKKHLNYFIIL